MKAIFTSLLSLLMISLTAQADTNTKDLLLPQEVVVTDYGQRANIKNASSVTALKSLDDLKYC